MYQETSSAYRGACPLLASYVREASKRQTDFSWLGVTCDVYHMSERNAGSIELQRYRAFYCIEYMLTKCILPWVASLAPPLELARTREALTSYLAWLGTVHDRQVIWRTETFMAARYKDTGTFSSSGLAEDDHANAAMYGFDAVKIVKSEKVLRDLALTGSSIRRLRANLKRPTVTIAPIGAAFAQVLTSSKNFYASESFSNEVVSLINITIENSTYGT